MRRKSRQRKIIKTILQWYTRRGRTLPWRLPPGKTGTHPYKILVSEIMLQQTQVARVLIKYPGFLRRFPTLRSLARARQHDVVIAWRGMGYNNRAVRLHQLANVIVHSHGGRLPRTAEGLLALPGVGRYTANALLSSVFGKDAAIVEVNVRRLFSRLLWRMNSTTEMRKESDIWQAAERLLPGGRAYDWNQALMDLGALICTARSPQCTVCPVARLCRSRTALANTAHAKPHKTTSRVTVPNRIYRGRIIDILRETHLGGVRAGIRAHVLGRRILPHYSNRKAIWLQGLLAGLVRDGLIRTRGNGTLATKRVMLA